MRFLALLMLVAQLGAFAAPALAAPPDGHTHHVCGAVQSPTAVVEAQSGGDCAACDMAECADMLGCIGAVSPALAAQSAANLVLPSVPDLGAQTVWRRIDHNAVSTSPPPKR